MRRTYLVLGFFLAALMPAASREDEGEGNNPLAKFLQPKVSKAARKKIEQVVAEATKDIPQAQAPEVKAEIVRAVVEAVNRMPQQAVTQFVKEISDEEAQKAATGSDEVLEHMGQQNPDESEFAVRQARANLQPRLNGRAYRQLVDWSGQSGTAVGASEFESAARGASNVVDARGLATDETKVGGVRIHLDADRLERLLEYARVRPDQAGRLLADLWKSPKDFQAILDRIDSEFAAVPSMLEANGLTVVSLRTVLDRFQAHPCDACYRLDTLTRIHGYALDPNGDVLLLGKSERGAPILELDSLIVALRVVYQLGRTPAVSIDPDPKQPGGAQHLKVFEVPPDSLFAQIMGDADYAMKLQMLTSGGGRKVAGFTSFLDAIRQAYDRGEALSTGGRFWLTPIQPTSGDLFLSRNRRVALFNTAVQILTEKGYCVESGLVFASRTDPAMEVAAQSMTEHYAQFENADPIFQKLHGLFDMVTLSSILRLQGVRSDVLDRLQKIAVRSVPVRTSYPGTVAMVDGVPMVLTGGVQILLRMSQRTFRSHRVVEEISDSIEAASQVNFRIPQFRRTARTEGEFQLALKDLASGRYARAAEKLAANLEKDPADVSSAVMKAYAHAMLKEWDAAHATIRKAMQLDPGDPFVRAWWNFVRIESGAISLGAVDVDEETRKELAALYFWRSQLYQWKQNLGAAMEDLDRSITVYDRWDEAYFWRGFLHQLRIAPDRAEEDFNRALALNPNFGWALLSRAFCKAGREDLAGAIADCDEALRGSPNFSAAFINRGYLRYCLGQYAQARVDWERAKTADPNDGIARLNVAWMQWMDGDKDGALAEIEEGLRRAGTYLESIALRGYQARLSGRRDEAIEIFTEGIRSMGKIHPWIYLDRARCYFEMERYAEAVEDFDAVVGVASYDTTLFYERAQALAKLGRYEDSKRDLEKFLRLAPEHPDAAKVKKMIEEMP